MTLNDTCVCGHFQGEHHHGVGLCHSCEYADFDQPCKEYQNRHGKVVNGYTFPAWCAAAKIVGAKEGMLSAAPYLAAWNAGENPHDEAKMAALGMRARMAVPTLDECHVPELSAGERLAMLDVWFVAVKEHLETAHAAFRGGGPLSNGESTKDHRKAWRELCRADAFMSALIQEYHRQTEGES